MTSTSQHITSYGGYDCLGNVGIITTESDCYVSDIYQPESSRWYSQETRTRGALKIEDGVATFSPIADAE